ncbi:MAG: sodium-dependent transporter [Bacteroidales bacterium]|nr:sodium-dependent transporter [Bacteroidales bacterium]
MKNANKQTTGTRESFGSSFGVLVALAGSAVGLGNLWRFPYLMGQNGGAAFVIIYLCFVCLIGLPIMMSEFIVGRRSHAGARGAYKSLAPGSFWGIGGIFAVICCTLILSFYSVVGGWGIEYLFKSLCFDFTRDTGTDLSSLFNTFTTSSWRPLICHTIFLAATAIIVLSGVKNGIEKFSKIMMPLLFIIMIGIAIRSLTLPGAEAGIDYLFKPDFSKVTGKTFLAALGQAFFSLSLGSGMVITYASYVSKKENILSLSVQTAVADTVFALIAGCAIIPAVFAFGISPGEGPGLVFITLPHIFSQLPMGGAIAILFFVALLLAALTSSISLLEVMVAFGCEEFKLKRKTAVALCFIVLWALGCLCSLSEGVLSNIKVFGKNFFDLFDYLSANVLMLIGGFMVVVFAGWRLGRAVIKDEMTNGGQLKIPNWFLDFLTFLMRFVAPAAMLAIAFFQVSE